MPAELAVALLGGGGLAGALGRRAGVEVVATTEDDHLEAAASLLERCDLVVGLSVVPWPTAASLHAEGSARLGAYAGVVSWHALPALADRLAEVVVPGARSGAHVLVTAADPGPDAAPADLVFLREVAEAIEARTPLPARSIAWRGTSRAPTAADALEILVTTRGVRDVVECPVAPGTGADRELAAAAERVGVRLACVDLGRGTLVELLADVVATVAGNELDGNGRGGPADGTPR